MSEAPSTSGDTDDVPEVDPGRNPGTPALYTEMLPLVEAGATVKQAARRFGGDAEEVDEIAAGFLRWQASEGDEDPDDDLARSLAAAEERIAELADENRSLRRRMADLRRLVTQAARVIEGD